MADRQRRARQASDFLSPVHLALYLFEIGIGIVVAFAIPVVIRVEMK